MESVFFEDDLLLEKTKWGMVEPKTGKHVNAQEIDIMIIPLLAYDKDGHRVGYGKGYYDRFLSTCKPTCKKIGISFFEEAVIEDVTPFDKAMDQCITPHDVIIFRR